jgi:serine/threonine-protein kinase
LKRVLGKYRLLGRLGEGAFGQVYRALDTVEGVQVALKLLLPTLQTPAFVEGFRREIRLVARLDHPNILPVKNADLIEGQLVVAYPLGERTLADRLRHRIAFDTTLDFGAQLLEALAYAHSRKVLHCDIKPENLILFPGNRLRLADFGIAKVSRRTLSASGSGTIGYVAPEQAMGKPSFRSDVFAVGLILYRMWTGILPEWPYDWPLPGHSLLRARATDAGVALLQRALQVDSRRRHRDAEQMLTAFRRVSAAIRRHRSSVRARRADPRRRKPAWRAQRVREFLSRHRGGLSLKARCPSCDGPLSEEMHWCPWCGRERARHLGPVSYPARCERCGRGRKLDWRFCAWCYGAGFGEVAARRYSDRRYAGRCSGCARQLAPLSRYCPWCRRKVQRKWTLPGTKVRCPRCGWSVFRDYWEHCCWCGADLRRRT